VTVVHQTGKQLIAMAIMYGVLSASGGATLAQTLGPQGNPPPQAKRPTVPGADGHPSEKFEKDSLVVTSEYYIGPEDVLEIIVWRNQDLSKVVTVRPDGRISLPLLGDIEATGLTPSELTANIVNRLKQFKETPTVSVILQQVNSYGM
jgi:protein involved in polysaccharide export with SLBB domain